MTRFVSEDPKLFCGEDCKMSWVQEIGKATYFAALKDSEQLALWADSAQCEGCLFCQHRIPSIPADAVYILARPDAERSGYYGFGCQIVERLSNVHIVACPPQSLNWMVSRLASGMQLWRGRLEFGEAYPTVEAARVDALELDTLVRR
jgi:hypothetical protein